METLTVSMPPAVTHVGTDCTAFAYHLLTSVIMYHIYWIILALYTSPLCRLKMFQISYSVQFHKNSHKSFASHINID